jgi:hypothetical protein
MCFFFISLGSLMQAQPPNDSPASVSPVDDDPLNGNRDCLNEASVYGSYSDDGNGRPGLFLLAQCPESTTFFLSLPDCEGCESPYEVSFNGLSVNLISKGSTVKPNIYNQYPSGQYTFQLDSRHISNSDGVLEIGFDCDYFGEGRSRKIDVKIIQEGSKYDIAVGNPRTFCNPLGPLETTALCNCGNLESVDEISLSGITTFSTVTEESPTTVTFTGVLAPKNAPFSFEVSIPLALGNTTTSNSSSNATTFSATMSSKNLPIGKCINPCYKECHLIRKYETFIASCENDDISLGITEKMVPGSARLSLTACNPPGLYNASENLCPTLNFKLKRKQNFNADETVCLGSIEVEIISGSTDLNYNWVGPNGFKSKSTTLENVPSGEYTLTLTDECCNSVSESYFLCSNSSQVTTWTFDELTQKWCADFTCSEPVGARSSCNVTRCVTADRVEIFYDNGFCKEMHFYEGEELGSPEEKNVEATREVEYDASSGNCIYKYFCEGDELNPVEVKEDSPTSIQWHYESLDNKCLLDVVCEDIEFENVEQIDPEIIYEWDDFNQKCFADYVMCDDNSINQYINTYPDFIGSWAYSSFPNLCYRYITCDNGDVLKDYGDYYEELIPNPNPDPSSTCVFSNYLIDVYCDGIKIATYDPCQELLNEEIEFRTSVKTISFDQIEEGILIKFIIPSDKRKVQINSIDAKIIFSKSIEKFSNDLFLDTSEFPTGMYIINILNGNENEGTFKYIKVKN